jgi:hypothetical protein
MRTRVPSRPDRELQAIGQHFGYPSCCVAAFCATLESGGFPSQRVGEGPWTGTGFIPCPEHAGDIRRVGMAEWASNNIHPNRRDRRPFGPGNNLDDSTLERICV